MILLILLHFLYYSTEIEQPTLENLKYTLVNKHTAPFEAGAIEPLGIQDFILS